MKKNFFFLFLFSLFSLIVPRRTWAKIGERCNYWTNKPCEENERCTQVGLGRYECQPAKPPPGCIRLPITHYSDCPSEAPYRCPKSFLCCPSEAGCITPAPPYDVCQGNAACIECQANRGGTWTALGCIPIPFERSQNGGDFNMTPFIIWLLKWTFGFAGGIALIIMITGAFKIITSAGDPDKVKAGKDMIGAAVAGLLLIILAVFLLQFITGAFELPIFK